jgi:hypothetical protein
MIETISEWETEKKVKAKRQKEQKEVFVDQKHYLLEQSTVFLIVIINSFIDGVASGCDPHVENQIIIMIHDTISY